MSPYMEIPELRSVEARDLLIRIPQEIDIPVTARIRHIIDTPEFRRLSRIPQLGLVSTVYPAANHTRFEHSLGVYRMALLYLQRLGHDRRFCEMIAPRDAELFLVAALLHDLGHWPFCHPIEDLRLPGVPRHELFANSLLLEGELADHLRDDWKIQPREIVSILSEKPRDNRSQILSSMISGPIDVDKMDYLYRDSLHAGVPYGRNFDRQRMIGSLCLNESRTGLAVTEKGRTAAEMMVFARYVMFSEVYWHHAVRAATAMFQRAFYELHGDLDLDALFRFQEHELITEMTAACGDGPAADLLAGLFGPRRRLYKRLAEFSHFQNSDLYNRISRRPYYWLTGCSEALAEELSRHLSRRVAPHEVLIDAPPVKLEVQVKVDIHFAREGTYRALADVSPVVRALAREQFDDFVKRVRIFIAPELADELADPEASMRLLENVIDSMDD